MNKLKKEALGAATPSTVNQPIITKETNMSNNILPRTAAQVAKEFPHQSWRNHQGAYIAQCYKTAKVFERTRDWRAGYEKDSQAAPKSMGMNDAPWVSDHNRPYITKEDGVEHSHSPIHGWPTSAGVIFDDDEFEKELKIAETRGYTCSLEPKHVNDKWTSWSQVQARAISQLLQVCSARGINPATFTEQQLYKYVQAFIAKQPTQTKTINLSRFK